MPVEAPVRQLSGARTRSHAEFTVQSLVAAKAGRRVSVCIPARDEEGTVARVVGPVVERLVPAGLVDEVLVLDHASRDRTASVAAAAGARVVRADAVLPEHGPALGKGDVLWRSLDVAVGDLVVWLDADLTSFDVHYVVGLLGPLIEDPNVALVRGTYDRLLDGAPGEGGRVTELLARPVIATLFPDLEHIRQPLGGEYAVRRDAVEQACFEVDYGVEMGLLLDITARHGAGSVVQVDLGERSHRNRPLSALREQARQVLRAALARTTLSDALRAGMVQRPPMRDIRLARETAG